MLFDPARVRACQVDPRLAQLAKADPDGWQALHCPRCGRSREQLQLLWWQSDAGSWKRRSGRAGLLLWCDACKLAVRFRLQLLN